MTTRRGKRQADAAYLEECILEENAIALLAQITAKTNSLARILKERAVIREETDWTTYG
jgi:hypothetical protein